jgi:hypothetical protein
MNKVDYLKKLNVTASYFENCKKKVKFYKK